MTRSGSESPKIIQSRHHSKKEAPPTSRNKDIYLASISFYFKTQLSIISSLEVSLDPTVVRSQLPFAPSPCVLYTYGNDGVYDIVL